MKKPEMKRIPKFVLSNYGGNTRKFKLEKRRQVKELGEKLSELRFCSAWMPYECINLIDEIDRAFFKLERSISVQSWRR